MNRKPKPPSLFSLISGGLAITIGLFLLLHFRFEGGAHYILQSGMVLTVFGCLAVLRALRLITFVYSPPGWDSSGGGAEVDGVSGGGDGGD